MTKVFQNSHKVTAFFANLQIFFTFFIKNRVLGVLGACFYVRKHKKKETSV